MPDENLIPDGPQARILKMANAGSLALGERGANTFARAELVATDEATADKLMKILQGMSAMLSLAETSDKQLGEFLNATNVSRNDRNVSLALAYPTDRILAMAQNLQKQQSPAPRNAPSRPAQQPITSGRTISEWSAIAVLEAGADTPLVRRVIENVELKNGATISLGRQGNGGKPTRFDRVEISASAGAPLIFGSSMMRTVRGNMSQFQFPGTDGVYTIAVAYVNDPDGKTRYAVSVRDPQAAPDGNAK